MFSDDPAVRVLIRLPPLADQNSMFGLRMN